MCPSSCSPLDVAQTLMRAPCRILGDFALSVLPETGPDSTCLDVLNYFQQGRSHILLVSKVSSPTPPAAIVSPLIALYSR